MVNLLSVSKRSLLDSKRSKTALAFTIVELLIVIVIIGILAAITIASYTGITAKATVAALTSDLDNASKQLKLIQIESSGFPDTIRCDIPDSIVNKCIKNSVGTTYQYTKSNATNPQTFCITATKSNYEYNITQDRIPEKGICPLGWWTFDGNANDSSGSGNHGTVSNVSLSDGARGGAYKLSTAADSTVTIPHNYNFNLTTYTYSFWVKLNSGYNGSWRRIMGRYGTGTEGVTDRSPGFWFYTTSNRVHLQQMLVNGSHGGGVDTDEISLNEWHQVVFQCEWDGTNTTFRSYLDGTGLKQYTYSVAPTLINSDLLTGNNDFEIDDIRIYNKILSRP